MRGERVVSMLPSATEMLFALGAGERVAGVTFECDYPAEAQAKAQVVQSHLPEGLSPAAIDALVRAEGAEGRSLYFADFGALERLHPDLIVLQDLCRVCAIDSPTMARDLAALPSRPELLTLSAHTLEGVLGDIERVGEAVGLPARAAQVVAGLRERLEAVRRMEVPARRPRVLALEWLEPFFQGGHWVPEMIALAGGEPVLAEAGAKSVRLRAEEVLQSDPDVVVVMPCGYHLPETVAQYRAMRFPEGWAAMRAVQAGRVYAVDGSAYFSRPGPRLVDGVEILAAMLRGLPGEYVAV